jgi:hypothetical protein
MFIQWITHYTTHLRIPELKSAIVFKWSFLLVNMDKKPYQLDRFPLSNNRVWIDRRIPFYRMNLGDQRCIDEPCSMK